MDGKASEKDFSSDLERPQVEISARFVGNAHIWSLVLLMAAAVSLLLFQNSKSGFETNSHQGYLSSHGMTLAKNLVIDGNWLFMFIEKFAQPDGSVVYDPYNPFPLFPFLLIGLVIRPLEPNLAAQVVAAHQLMNLFFAGAMALCFLTTRELLRNPWQALTVTLLAFSSYYMLTYNDLIFNDVPALFGCMLMLLMVVKIKSGTESGTADARAWLWTPILAISMGWQPYAVLAAWLLLDLPAALWTRQSLRTLLRRPAVIAFAVAVGWGVTVLILQALNESRVQGGSPLAGSLFQKALWRLGLQPQDWYTGNEILLTWPEFLQLQMNRSAMMLVPFGYGLFIQIREIVVAGLLLFVLGIVSFRRQLSLYALALLILSCMMWAVPMRQFVSVHDFQALFLVGIAIAFFSVLVLYIRPPVAPVVAVAICALFILSVYRINQDKNAVAQVVNPITAEFQTIYERLPRGSKVFVCGERTTLAGGHHAVDFYLAGTYTTTDVNRADYIVIKGATAVPNAVALTDNPTFNLFQRQGQVDFSQGECDT